VPADFQKAVIQQKLNSFGYFFLEIIDFKNLPFYVMRVSVIMSFMFRLRAIDSESQITLKPCGTDFINNNIFSISYKDDYRAAQFLMQSAMKVF